MSSFKSLSNKSFFLERFVNLKHSSCYLSFSHKILKNGCETRIFVALRNGTGEIKFPLSDILSFTNYLASKVLFYGTRVRSRHATTDLGPSHIVYMLNIYYVAASLREKFTLRIASISLKLVHWCYRCEALWLEKWSRCRSRCRT